MEQFGCSLDDKVVILRFSVFNSLIENWCETVDNCCRTIIKNRLDLMNLQGIFVVFFLGVKHTYVEVVIYLMGN